MIKKLDIRPGPLLYGAATFIPGVTRWRRRGTGGTVSARYCYSVWLRHWVQHVRLGLREVPATVAEIGPGDSLGVGLAALLSGAEQVMALDFIRYAETARNETVLDALTGLFRDRAGVPGESEFPDVMPGLDSYRFPDPLFPGKRLDANLHPERISRIRQAVRSAGAERGNGMIRYAAPWTDPNVIRDASADMILSQAVLEHVNDLEATYRAMRLWLKPGGRMSHVVDFSSHGLTRSWNGHWGVPDSAWSLIRGKRPYLINREPLSVHIRLLEREGFRILDVIPRSGPPGITRNRLARRFASLTDEDLNVSCAFIAAEKPPSAPEPRRRPRT